LINNNPAETNSIKYIKLTIYNNIYKMSKNQIVQDFNVMLIELASQITKLCPQSIIANNLNNIIDVTQRYPLKIMEIFVIYVLKYKTQIDAGDENFFMNKSYDDDLKENNQMVSKIFEFKTIWVQLNKANRLIVQQYMQYLCQLALTYIS
jgi:hypothetical protein